MFDRLRTRGACEGGKEGKSCWIGRIGYDARLRSVEYGRFMAASCALLRKGYVGEG